MDVNAQTLKGISWTSLSALATTILKTFQLIFLARFLSPEEFGLMSLIWIVMGLSQSFMDAGISNSIIQKKNIEKKQLSTLYWTNILAGLIITVTIFFLSVPISMLFEDPRLIEYLQISSLLFIFASIGNQYRVLHQKNLEFKLVSKVEITSIFISVVISIAMAVNGFGVISLIASMLLQTLISSLFFLIFGSYKYGLPTLYFRLSEVKDFLVFGLYQMGERMVNYLGANSDKILIGKLLGVQALGFYEIAWRIIMFPIYKLNPAISRVLFPIYSKIQDKQEIIQKLYENNLQLLSLIIGPLFIYLSFYSDQVTFILFGEGWETTAQIISILSLVGLMRMLGNPGGGILLAKGYANVGFYWNLFWVPFTTLCIYLSILLMNEVTLIPLVWVAMLVTVGNIWYYLIFRYGGISFKNILKNVFLIFFVIIFIVAMSNILINSLSINNPFLIILLSILFCICMYAPYIFFIYTRKKNTFEIEY